MFTAEVTEFENLLIAAGGSPVEIPGAVEKTQQKLPGGFQDSTWREYGENYRALLQVAQASFWTPYEHNIILWGTNGTGKTSLLTAMTQLTYQVGYDCTYLQCGRNSRTLPYTPEDHSGIKKTAFIDQLDEYGERVADDFHVDRHYRKSMATTNDNPEEILGWQPPSRNIGIAPENGYFNGRTGIRMVLNSKNPEPGNYYNPELEIDLKNSFILTDEFIRGDRSTCSFADLQHRTTFFVPWQKKVWGQTNLFEALERRFR